MFNKSRGVLGHVTGIERRRAGIDPARGIKKLLRGCQLQLVVVEAQNARELVESLAPVSDFDFHALFRLLGTVIQRVRQS